MIGDLIVGGLKQTAGTVLENSHVFSTTQGELYTFTVLNYSTSIRQLLVFDSTALPSNGTVTPVWFYPIPAGSASGPGALSVLDTYPMAFATGITFAVSTVVKKPFSLTVPTDTMYAFTAQWKNS